MKNTNEKQNKLNPILSKIAKILNYSKQDIEELKQKQEKEWVSKVVDSILQENKENKELILFLLKSYNKNIFSIIDNKLKSDKEIALAAIRRSSDSFYSIDKKLQWDILIARETIKSQVRERKDFFEIERFILKYFPKKAKELFDFHQKYLDASWKIFKDDLSKTFILIRTLNPEFYKNLKQKNIIISKLWSPTISNKFIKDFTKNLENIFSDINLEEIESYKNIIISKLQTSLWIIYEDSDSNIQFIFDSIIKLVNLEIQRSKKFKDFRERLLNKLKNKVKENESKDDNKEEKEEDIDDFDELLDYCSPSCSASITDWWYLVDTPLNMKVKITENEKNDFTSESLRNFIKFYNTLYNLWLNFLWDKYKSDFLVILNNNDINYTSWFWVTEFKLLKTLNIIWKNIWVPEYKVLDENWKETNESRCFKTIWDAKLIFEEIKSTWKINWEKLSDNNMYSYWAVENKLILSWKIDKNWNWLNISKWR